MPACLAARVLIWALTMALGGLGALQRAVPPPPSRSGVPSHVTLPRYRFEPAKVKETIAEVFKQKFSEGFEYNADDAAEMGTEVCTEIQARIKGGHHTDQGWGSRHTVVCRCRVRVPLDQESNPWADRLRCVLCCRAGLQKVQADHAGDNRGDEGPDNANWIEVFVGRAERQLCIRGATE